MRADAASIMAVAPVVIAIPRLLAPQPAQNAILVTIPKVMRVAGVSVTLPIYNANEKPDLQQVRLFIGRRKITFQSIAGTTEAISGMSICA